MMNRLLLVLAAMTLAVSANAIELKAPKADGRGRIDRDGRAGQERGAGREDSAAVRAAKARGRTGETARTEDNKKAEENAQKLIDSVRAIDSSTALTKADVAKRLSRQDGTFLLSLKSSVEALKGKDTRNVSAVVDSILEFSEGALNKGKKLSDVFDAAKLEELMSYTVADAKENPNGDVAKAVAEIFSRAAAKLNGGFGGTADPFEVFKAELDKYLKEDLKITDDAKRKEAIDSLGTCLLLGRKA